ncbi:uncharacterized protein FN964_006225 [Alca torda]
MVKQHREGSGRRQTKRGTAAALTGDGRAPQAFMHHHRSIRQPFHRTMECNLRQGRVFFWIQKSAALMAFLGALLSINWFMQKALQSGPEATAHPSVPGHLHHAVCCVLPEGSCSAVGLGMGEPMLLEAPCHGHFSRDAGRGKLSLQRSSGCQTGSSRKTTPFWFLITQIEYHLPCILPKLRSGSRRSTHTASVTAALTPATLPGRKTPTGTRTPDASSAEPRGTW